MLLKYLTKSKHPNFLPDLLWGRVCQCFCSLNIQCTLGVCVCLQTGQHKVCVGVSDSSSLSSVCTGLIPLSCWTIKLPALLSAYLCSRLNYKLKPQLSSPTAGRPLTSDQRRRKRKQQEEERGVKSRLGRKSLFIQADDPVCVFLLTSEPEVKLGKQWLLYFRQRQNPCVKVIMTDGLKFWLPLSAAGNINSKNDSFQMFDWGLFKKTFQPLFTFYQKSWLWD